MSKTFGKTVKILLSAGFLALMVLLLTWFKLTQPRILVLHSYDKGYEWTRDIDIGLKRVLDPKLRYRVHWHYMDVKNHPDKEFKRRAALLAQRAIDNWNPDLIIAVDDDAQQYVVKNFVNRRGVTIVFAGINGSIEPYGYHKAANVTGILERKSWRDIHQALIAMRSASGKPLGKRLIHIGDASESVAADAKELVAFDWSPLKLVESKLVATFDEWKAAIAEAGKRADLILISNYRALYRQPGKPDVVPPDEIISWSTANSAVPLIGMGGFFVDDGGMFAVGTSGFEQGEVAARMAVRILDDEALPQDIPVAMPRQFIIYMRKSMMAGRDLSLPQLYESFARATNNFYE